MGWKIPDKLLVDPSDNDSVPFDQGGIIRRSTWIKIKDYILGTKTLTTTDKTMRGAVNEVNASLSKMAKLSTTPQKTTANIVYYVSPTGLDTNDGLTSGTAFKTINKALSKLPRILDHNVNIYITDGTYPESINISGFTGSGTITITGNTTTPDNCSISDITIYNNNIFVSIVGINITTTLKTAIYILSSTYVSINKFNISTSANFSGVKVAYSSAIISNGTISNRSNAIEATASKVYSYANTGSNNAVGLFAIGCGEIGKYSTQPSGTVAESASRGGEIG